MAEMKDIFVYDLMAKLRRDPRKAAEVQKALDDSARIAHLLSNGKADRADMSRALGRIVVACGMNFGMMLPRIFPRYPTVEPLSLMQRPFMFAMTTLAANSVLTLRAGRQVGKCADAATEVETESHGRLTLGEMFAMGA